MTLPLLHSSSIEVRYYETDQMGVVHHSNYIRYMEIARGKVFESLGLPYAEVEARGVMMPVVEVECRYLFPAHYGEVLRADTYLQKLSGARLIFYCELFNPTGTLLAKGSVTLGFIDKESRRPVRCPDYVRRLFTISRA